MSSKNKYVRSMFISSNGDVKKSKKSKKISSAGGINKKRVLSVILSLAISISFRTIESIPFSVEAASPEAKAFNTLQEPARPLEKKFVINLQTTPAVTTEVAVTTTLETTKASETTVTETTTTTTTTVVATEANVVEEDDQVIEENNNYEEWSEEESPASEEESITATEDVSVEETAVESSGEPLSEEDLYLSLTDEEIYASVMSLGVVSWDDYVYLCNVTGSEAMSSWISLYEKGLICEEVYNRIYSSGFPDTVYGVLTHEINGVAQYSNYKSYMYLGTFSGEATHAVKAAVLYYFEHPSEYTHGYRFHWGDGYTNYFRVDY